MKYLIAVLLMSSVVYAAESANLAPRPTLDIPRALTLPLVTAAADDPAWTNAAVIPALQPAYNHRLAKHDGRPTTMPSNEPASTPATSTPATSTPATSTPATSVRILWTPEALYLRCVAFDDDVYTPENQRDSDLYKGDVFEVFLDPVGDGRVLFEVGAAPNGAVYDTVTLVTGNPVPGETLALDWDFVNREVWFDRNWNLDGLRSAASRTTDGWIIDVVLPAKGLQRRTGGDTFAPEQLIRANVLRYDYPKGPDGKREHLPLDWAPTLAGCPHISAAALGTFRLLP